MIPREFFDWVIVQWWGPPAFIVVTWSAMILFAWAMAVATERR